MHLIAIERIRALDFYFLTPQLLRIMKLTTIMMLTTCLMVSASGFSQRITLQAKNVSIENVFKTIETQSGYVFFYDYNVLSKTKPVTINVKSVTLNEALKKCFEGQPFLYDVVGKTIVVKEKSQTSEKVANGNYPEVILSQFSMISGIVTDESTRMPLFGVTVRVKNTNNVVITDKDGKFLLKNVEKNAILVISYVGYEPREVSVTGQTKIQVALKRSVEKLDELVVIGYGTVAKKDLTGSVGLVNLDDIKKAPVANMGEALAGRIAGLQVTSDDGQPGTEMNIVIRGGNSITQNNSPLYVIDGFPMEDFSIMTLNPDDVKSISILKDASSTAIYGSRAANGVIIVETKKGGFSSPLITYNAYYGLQKVSKRMDLMEPYEFVKYQLELNEAIAKDIYLTSLDRELEDYKNVKGYDWQNSLFKTGPIYNHNISVGGGTTGTRYFFSGNMTDQKGVIDYTGLKKYQGRLNLEQRLSKKIKSDIRLNYSRDKNYGQLSNAIDVYPMLRIWGGRPVTPSGDLMDLLFDDEDGAPGLLNPIISNKNEFRQQTRTNFGANTSIDYAILPNLKLKMQGGYTSTVLRREYFNNSKTYSGYPSGNNTKGVNGGFSDRTFATWLSENTINYVKNINKSHEINMLLGWTMQGRNSDTYSFESIQVPNEELGIRSLGTGTPSNVTSEATVNTMLSYLGRLNYSYKNKYLLTATFRADGSSRFVKKNRWAYFPSFAAAWNMKRERFLSNRGFIGTSKLKASWGTTGNNDVGDFAPYSAGTVGDYYGIGTGSSMPDYAFIISNFGNKDLRWETTSQFDLGYELGLFNNRINIEADYYHKITKDLLLNANVPYATGFTKIYKNIGSIQNKGFELTVNTVNIRNKNFVWNSSFNISFNQNEILSLADDEKNMFTDVRFTASAWDGAKLYLAQVGKPVASFYGLIWDGTYQLEDFDLLANGTYVLKSTVTTNGDSRNSIQPGDIKYKDSNGDRIIDEKDKMIIGRTQPRYYGGFNNDFSYKGLNLSVFFQWSYGNQIMNANRIMFEGNAINRIGLNQFTTYEDRWSLDNQSSKNHRTGGEGPLGFYSTKQLEDGSYLRLKTVQLSYRLPKTWIPYVSSIDINISAQNLYTWTNYTGMDPEVSSRNSILTPGFDFSAYARPRTTSLGLKVVF